MTNEQIAEGAKLIWKFMDYGVWHNGILMPMNLDPSGSERNGNWQEYENVPIEWNLLVPVYSRIMNTEFSSVNKRFELQRQFEEAVFHNRLELGFETIVEYLKSRK